MAVTQEFYKNDPTTSTTLNGAIDNAVTSVVVSDGSVFPSSGIFRIRIDNEILKVTARSTNTLTVVRGTEGSTAASHADTTTVTMVLTKVAFERVGTQIHGKPGDTFANRPSPTEDNEGQLYIPSDGYSWARNEGGVWVPYGPAWKFTPPVNGDFSWVNQGGATVTADKDAILLSEAGQGSGTNLRCRVKSAPSTPYIITACLLMDAGLFLKAQNGSGLLWRDSSGGGIVVFGIVQSQIRHFKYTSATSVNAAYRSLSPVGSIPIWWRISDDGTNRKCFWSFDGLTFVEFAAAAAVGHTDFITPNQVGFFITAENSATPNHDVNMTVLSWKET